VDIHWPSQKVLITGKSGTGKTELLLLRIAESRHDYLFIFDPDLEFAARAGVDYCCDLASAAECLKRKIPVCFDCSEIFPGDRVGGFTLFCEWVYQICKVLPGRKVLVIDEIQKYVMPSPSHAPAPFQMLLDEGRRFKVDMILVSRRPNKVNEAIRAELTETICFQHTDRRPLIWLEEDGLDPDEVRALEKPGGYLSKEL